MVSLIEIEKINGNMVLFCTDLKCVINVTHKFKGAVNIVAC